ncbi:MAG: hypothetical protein ACOY3N_09310 [Bradyrhizobium sp.]|uniref:hypothetical protein n=1 Tax=Bradyrhizobium sp. TaxID=376 RepID=UPI003BF288BA
MTDYLIKTDGTSSGLTLGSAISDTDAIEIQQSFSAPATTLHQTFAAVKTWIKSWIVKGDVGLGNVSNDAQLTIANNLSDVGSAVTSRANLGVSAFFKAYQSSKYYLFPFTSPTSSISVTANRLYLFPVMVPRSVTVSQLFARIGTGSSGNFQAAFYASDGTTQMPTGTALASTASGSTTSGNTTVPVSLGANQSLTEGAIYWVAIMVDNASATFTGLGVATMAWLIGDSTASNIIVSGSASVSSGYNIANSGSFGSWPDLTGGSFTANGSNAMPLVGFRVA